MKLNSNIIWVDSVESTNKFIKNLVVNSAIKNGTIIAAKEQTKGVGQAKNKWLSNSNQNLTFSIYVEPQIKAIYQFYLSKIIALSIYEYINIKITNVSIKWPNDIYVENKKISGTLIENIIQGEYITKTIIGIGININQVVFDNSLLNPVSLKAITKKTYNLKNELLKLISIINTNLELINLFSIIDNKYNKLLYRLNNSCYFLDKNNNKFKGIIVGTATDGRIKIKTQNLIKRFGLNEIQYIL